MLTQGGASSGSQGLGFLHILLQLLTLSLQLCPDSALTDLAVNEIVSQLTLENVVEEMFLDSPA